MIFPQSAEAQIQSVELVTVRGTTYAVSDVRSHTHTHGLWGKKILILNTVENNDKPQYPLEILAEEIPKDVLKRIPDRRPYQQKHPFLYYLGYQGPMMAWNIVSTFR